MSSFEEYVYQLEQDGYINETSVPLKCIHCDCEQLVEGDYYYEGHLGLVEYGVFCKNCGKETGRWSYGNWSLH